MEADAARTARAEEPCLVFGDLQGQDAAGVATEGVLERESLLIPYLEESVRTGAAKLAGHGRGCRQFGFQKR